MTCAQRWAGVLALLLLASAPAHADVAESLEVQVRHARAYRLDTPVTRVIVVSPDIVQATTVGRDTVELYGLKIGRSMVLVWTERTRYTLVVEVTPEPWAPDIGAPEEAVEGPAQQPGTSLYTYRGTAEASASDTSRVTQQHQLTAYVPVGPGNFFANIVGTLVPEQPANLASFYLRYRDPLMTLEGGDFNSFTSPLDSSPAQMRGLAGEYHGGKLRLGAFGGLEPGGTRPRAVLDPDRPRRYGGYAGFELAPNAELSAAGVRREEVVTPTGLQNVVLFTPSLRWEPTSSLSLNTDAGVSQTGQGFKTQVRYEVPAFDVSTSYWHQSDGFLYDGALRTDIATASLTVRPSRRMYLWGVASRASQGGDLLGSQDTTVMTRGNESAQLVFMAPPMLERISFGVNHNSVQTEFALAGLSLEEENTDLTVTIDRRLGDEFGRLQLSVLGGQGARTLEDETQDYQRRGGEVGWHYNTGNLFFVTAGGHLREDLDNASADRHSRTFLRQSLSLSWTHFLAMASFELGRDSYKGVDALPGTIAATDTLSRDQLTAFLSGVFRPTQAHELRFDVAVSNLLYGAPANQIAPAAVGSVPTNVDMMLTYSFHFGDAVQAPGVLDMLATETMRIEAFLDLDEDGERDEDEPPMPDMSCYIDNGPKNVTNSAGIASQSGLGPGMHRFIVDVNGAGAGGRRLRFTTASTRSIYIGPGEEAIVYVGVSDRAQINGSLFNDADLDGQRQLNEPGFPRMTVTLLQGGHVVATTTTDQNGGFAFSRLAPGPYSVRFSPEQLPPELQPVQTELNLDLGSSDLVRAAFPVIANRIIEGVVYIDANQNGRRDEGEQGLSHAVIRFGDRTVTSNGGGKYLIRKLPGGDLDLAIDPVSLPPGHEPSEIKTRVSLPVTPGTVNLDLPVRRQRPVSSAQGSPMPQGSLR